MLKLKDDICKEIAAGIVEKWINRYGLERVIMTIAGCEESFSEAAIKLSNDVGNDIASKDCGFYALYETLEPFIEQDLRETWDQHAIDSKNFIKNNSRLYGSVD